MAHVAGAAMPRKPFVKRCAAARRMPHSAPWLPKDLEHRALGFIGFRVGCYNVGVIIWGVEYRGYNIRVTI